MPRKDGNKKHRLLNDLGKPIKPSTRLDDYYSFKLQLFIETLLTEDYNVWSHLKRRPVKPLYEARTRGGRRNERPGQKRSNIRTNRNSPR